MTQSAHPGTAAPANAIEAHDVRKVYRAQGGQPEKLALKGVSLTVPRGSIFGLLGPNGAGKSTFINIMAGMVVKTSGTVAVWGTDIDAAPRQARAAIGVVPQELHIDPFFTPLEALEIQSGLYGVPKAERRCDEILEALGLGDKKDAYARTLSGGMRRRLLVAKALVHNPPVLVLDEPTAGVDIELRRQLWDYVRALHARGTTIVLTTHYLEEAQELCDTIAIIDQGQVVCCEPTPDLLARVDEKAVIVEAEQPLTALPEALTPARLPEGGPRVLLRPDGRLVLSYNRSRETMSDIIALVQSADLVIRDLSTEESDLEDIFLQLTGTAAAEAAA
ncbi:MAG: ABC transporter ATP-binding protein, partial [Alphaproteobacteria bacterium]